jgi:hypothetical protein
MDHVSVARRVPPTRYAQSAGAKIAYQVSGEGSRDLVFVSGLVSHLDLQWQQLSYRRFVTALEHACRVIRLINGVLGCPIRPTRCRAWTSG